MARNKYRAHTIVNKADLPRGGHVHNFSQGLQNWEASVFDDAIMFVLQYLRRDIAERRFEFATFKDAVEHAQSQPDPACLYAVTVSGRSALLERKKWDEWMLRAEGGSK